MAEELVDIINDQDQVIDTVVRSHMRQHHLPHRSTYVLLMDTNLRIVVEVRTLSKDYAPGMFDACIGGVVQSGEDPTLSAKREVLEEVGVDVDSIEFYDLGKLKIPYKTIDGFVMAYLYLARGSFITKRQKSEVSAIMHLSPEELERLAPKTTHDSVVAYKEIFCRAKDLGVI